MTTVSPVLQGYLATLAEEWRKTGHTAVADELDALIGTPVRQHRSDADCWCRPFPVGSGAFQHRHVP